VGSGFPLPAFAGTGFAGMTRYRYFEEDYLSIALPL